MIATQNSRFEKIVRETQAKLRAYIAGMGIGVDDIDDLTQEVYLAFYRDMEKIPAEVETVRWLKGIARNLTQNHLRKNRRADSQRMAAISEILARSPVTLEDLAGRMDNRERLAQCLEKLPERHRRMLELRYRDGLTSNVIAESMSSSAEAIRRALFRINNALRQCLHQNAGAIQ